MCASSEPRATLQGPPVPVRSVFSLGDRPVLTIGTDSGNVRVLPTPKAVARTPKVLLSPKALLDPFGAGMLAL